MKKRILSILLAATMLLSLVPMTVFADKAGDGQTPQYTTYKNWQIKHGGNGWEWENMEKVEEGLFRLEIFWQGTGFNVKSGENPIKKDWYATDDSDVTMAEEVIPPITVDVYLRVIDDETLNIGIGEAPAPAHTTHSFTYTANNGKITATCTAGCDKGYDTNPLTLTLTAPASLVYDGNAKAFTFADGEADAWTGAGLELPTIIYQIKQSGQSTYMPLLGTLKDAGNYMAQITVGDKTAQVYFSIEAPHTHNLVKVDGQAATESAAGFKDYYECKDSTDACHKYFEDVTGLIPIEDLDAWKSQNGKGYIPSGNEINATKEALDSENANNPKSTETGDDSHMALWVMMLALSSTGLCACLAYDKKRKNEQ